MWIHFDGKISEKIDFENSNVGGGKQIELIFSCSSNYTMPLVTSYYPDMMSCIY